MFSTYLACFVMGCRAAPQQTEPALPEIPVQPTPVDVAPVAEPVFEDWLLPYDDERIALGLAYLQQHSALVQSEATIEPRVVVLHWTASATAQSTWRTFESSRLAGRPELVGAGALNVSAHFLVDRDGTIYRLMPETALARHVIGLNHVAVGIENVGGTPDLPLTDAQAVANAAIVRWLTARHAITHLIGHHQYRQLEGHSYWRESDPTYRTTKIDPGDDFVRRVALAVADLGLEGAP